MITSHTVKRGKNYGKEPIVAKAQRRKLGQKIERLRLFLNGRRIPQGGRETS